MLNAPKLFLIIGTISFSALAAELTPINDNYEKIKSTNTAIRRNAAIYLGSDSQPKTIDVLQSYLNDPDSSVRRAVVSSLSRIVNNNPNISSDKIRLNNLTSALTTQFSIDENIGVRISIINALGIIRNNFSRKFLLQMLKDPYPIYRAEALRAIQNYQNPEDYSLIVQGLTDEAEGVRITAAEIIANRKIKNATSLLLKNLADPVMPVRLSMVRALGEIGTARELGGLEKMLNDSDPTVRQAAQEAIEKIKQRQTR